MFITTYNIKHSENISFRNIHTYILYIVKAQFQTFKLYEYIILRGVVTKMYNLLLRFSTLFLSNTICNKINYCQLVIISVNYFWAHFIFIWCCCSTNCPMYINDVSCIDMYTYKYNPCSEYISIMYLVLIKIELLNYICRS